MTDLPIWSDDTTTGNGSTISAQQQQRRRVLVLLWTTVSVLTTMLVLGMESYSLVLPATFSGTLFLEENLRGSPAIGLPESDEDDQYYEWNVVSKRVHRDPAVTLLLAESLLGSPAIGAKPLEDDDDEDGDDDDDDDNKPSSTDESGDEQVSEKKDREPSILEGMLQVWNGNFRVEDEKSSDSGSSDEEYYDNNEDDLIDARDSAPEMALAQA